MTNQIDEYCDYLIRNGRKASSIKVYRSQIGTCIAMLEKGGMNTDAKSIGEDEIYYLIRTLDMTEPTVKNYINVLGGMLEYYNGTSLIKKMKILWNRPIRHRIFITTDEFVRMFEIADDREKLILVLGAFMGLRRDEMKHISLTDIRRDRILIHGKGHNKGLICEQPMPIEVKQIIDRYMRWRQSLPGIDMSEGRLLVWYDPKRNVINRFADDSGRLSDMVRELGERAGVTVTCHSLRRLFCTNLYYGMDGKGGTDLVTVKDLMRHSSINTTLNCYINVKDQEKDEAVRKFSADFGRVLNINRCIT